MLIVHQPLANTTNTGPFNVSARIQHKSGIASANIRWRSDTTQAFASAAMSNSSGFTWQGNIPAQLAGSTVHYYIEASSQSGKTQTRPMPAPAASWEFNITVPVSFSEISVPEIQNIFPNPSKGITCIPVFSKSDSEGKISLVDVMGREIRVIHEGKIPAGSTKYFLNSLDVAEGAYVILIQTGKGNSARMLVVR